MSIWSVSTIEGWRKHWPGEECWLYFTWHTKRRMLGGLGLGHMVQTRGHFNRCLRLSEASSRICYVWRFSRSRWKMLVLSSGPQPQARSPHLLLSLSTPLMVHLEAHSYRSKAGFHLSGWPTSSQSMEPIVLCIDLWTFFSVNHIIWWAQRSRVTFIQDSILGSKQLLHHHLMLPGVAFGSISAWRSARLLLLFGQTSQVFQRFLIEMLWDLLLISWFVSFTLTVSRSQGKHMVPQSGRACAHDLIKQGREENPPRLIELRFLYRENWTACWSRRTFMAANGNVSQRELAQVGFWQTN